MEPIPLSRLLIGYAIMFLLPAAVAWFPRSWWARTLRRSVGPDLNVKTQSRTDCFRGAATFLLFGTVALALGFATFSLAESWFGSVDRYPAFAVLFFTYALLGLLGIGGAVYLAVRAPFRPAVIPTPIKITVLKEYRAVTGSGVARVFSQDDAQAYGLLVPLPPPRDPDAPVEWEALGPFATLEEAEREALRVTGHLRDIGV